MTYHTQHRDYPVDRRGDPITNVRSRDLELGSPEEIYEYLTRRDSAADVRLILSIAGDVYRALIDYPVVVEAWERMKSSGKERRLFHETFTKSERRQIQTYHSKWYDWYLREGTPRRIICRGATLQMQLRAVDFFGQL